MTINLSYTDKKQLKKATDKMDYVEIERLLKIGGYSFFSCGTCDRKSELLLIVRILKIQDYFNEGEDNTENVG